MIKIKPYIFTIFMLSLASCSLFSDYDYMADQPPQKELDVKDVQIAEKDKGRALAYFTQIRNRLGNIGYQQYRKEEEGILSLKVLLSSKGKVLDTFVNQDETTISQQLTKRIVDGIRYHRCPHFPDCIKNQKALSFNVKFDLQIAKKTNSIPT